MNAKRPRNGKRESGDISPVQTKRSNISDMVKLLVPFELRRKF